MLTSFVITLRFLQPYAHGRGDGGQPEWPPSPLRLFQALAAAAAGYWNERMRLAYAVPALAWLECLPPPTVVAALGTRAGTRRRHYVPDNIGDKVAKSWSRGGTDDIANYRTEKDAWPMNLTSNAVHYLFNVADDLEFPKHKETLAAAARAITHLGWGIDHVVGEARTLSDSDVQKLDGERWLPAAGNGDELRTPIRGTLDNLMTKHESFLNRLQRDARGNESFLPVPPLTVYQVVSYRRTTDAEARPFVAFQILKPDLEGMRSFDTPRRCRDVAAWVRHVAGEACVGWPYEETVEAFVHGHDGKDKPIKGERAERRFMYLPLPSIERRGERGNHVGAIRRVLVAAPPGCGEQVAWVRKRLAGMELVDLNGEVRGVLNLLPKSDWVLRQYTEPAATWATVTPVVLPGHDDHDVGKAAELLRRAFLHAGFAPELLNHPEFDFDFRKVGFLPGVDHADRYVLPEHPQVKGPRYHVWIHFPHAIPGPLAVGALRYRGFGLFARVDS